jgi:2-hydroxychromene-2-carboxylate isomerase
VSTAIEFYFDFSSPYSYIASEQIEALAARTARPLQWRPILLGAVFKESGGAPLTEVYGPKARYSIRDFARAAAFVGVPYRHPTTFPIGAVAASRAVLWLQREMSPLVAAYIHAVFRAFFVDDRNVGEATVALDVAQSLGIDQVQLAAGVQEDSIKKALRAQVEEAIARGVFGAPTIFVNGEMFWGHDRLAQVERWIAHGPF